jgi:hypothetical protein
MECKIYIILILAIIYCYFLIKNIIDVLFPVRWKTYVIKKNKHTSRITIAPYSYTFLKFKVIFDKTSIYQTKIPTNQGDINKLYGFSDCSNSHHVNSARIGWRWYNEELELFAYVYTNGNRKSKKITSVDINQEIDCQILTKETKYIFLVNNHTVTLPRGCSKMDGIRYQLFPYFGGDEKAPHNIKIKIKEIN